MSRSWWNYGSSDIDLLIIGDFNERLFERIGKILDLTDLPIEPLVYTMDEFEEFKRSGNPFITEILKTAVSIGKERQVKVKVEVKQ